jgi:hypothetical protein
LSGNGQGGTGGQGGHCIDSLVDEVFREEAQRLAAEGSGAQQGGRGRGERRGGGEGEGGEERGRGGASGVNWDSLVNDVFYQEVKEMVNALTDQHKNNQD